MNADRLRVLWYAVPFRPFTIRLPGGERLPVTRPDSLGMSPSGRTVNVCKGDSFVYLDPARIEIEVEI